MDPYGLPVQQLAELTGVSTATAQRWRRQGRIPPAAARLVELYLRFDLGAIDPAWSDFTLRRGVLWTPYGFAVAPGEISARAYRFAQIRALETALELPRQLPLWR